MPDEDHPALMPGHAMTTIGDRADGDGADRLLAADTWEGHERDLRAIRRCRPDTSSRRNRSRALLDDSSR